VISCASAAFGDAPLGPPTADLDQGQFRVGAEYVYGETDLECDAKSGVVRGTVEDLESNVVLGHLGYGMTKDWEACVRLGAGHAEFDMEDYSFALPEAAQNQRLHFPDRRFDGDYEFAWSFGTKYTFWRQRDNFRWGVMFQMAWFDSDDSVTGSVDQTLEAEGQEFTIEGDYAMGVELEYYEVQIALGPTWQVTDGLCLYGGPFLLYVNGDMDVDLDGSFTVRDSGGGLIDEVPLSVRQTDDLEQESAFGGFTGAQLDIAEHAEVFLEAQLTSDSWALGIGGGWWF
jgi:hypothetical protein